MSRYKYTTEQIQEVMSNLPTLSSFIGVNGQNAHPIHGSTGGKNFLVNNDKGWVCYRCPSSSPKQINSGGHHLEWVAIQDFGITCSDAKQFVENNFLMVFEKAAEYTTIELISQNNKPLTEFDKIKDRLYADAQEFFVEQFWANDKIVREVKKRRGFTDDNLRDFGFGFAPEGFELFGYMLENKGYSLRDLHKSGLFINHLNKPHFQGRITTPNYVGKLIKYFYGRTSQLTPDDEFETGRKYKKVMQHSSDSRIDKSVSEPIFGSDTINHSTRKVIITEGLTDALSLMVWGYSTLSPITVRFNLKQSETINNLIRSNMEVYICNDNENNLSGLMGAFSMLEYMPHAKIITLPKAEGQDKIDINDYFQSHTKQDFDKLIEQAKSGLEMKAEYTQSIVDYAYIAFQELDIDLVRKVKNLDDDTKKSIPYVYQKPVEVLSTIKFNHVVTLINFILSDKNIQSLNLLSNKEKSQVVARIIFYHMRYKHEDATFLVDEENVKLDEGSKKGIENHMWYFDGYKIYNIGLFSTYLAANYNIIDNKISMEVILYLSTKAMYYGNYITPIKIFRYDQIKNVVYYQCGKYDYYEISKDGIIMRRNGYHNIFFVEEFVDYFEYVDEDKRIYEPSKEGMRDDLPDWVNSPLLKMIIGKANLKDSYALNIEMQQMMIAFIMLTPIFKELFPVSPTVLLHGDTNSGKSIWEQNLYRLFTKISNQLHGDFTKKDDRTIINFFLSRPIAFLDDIASTDLNMLNRIIGIVTGQTFGMHKFYTEFGYEEKKNQPLILINTNEPSYFVKHDLVNRSLYLNFKEVPMHKRADERYISGEMADNMPELKSAFIDIIQKMVMKFDGDFEYYNKEHQVRFGEWINVSYNITKILGIDEDLFDKFVKALIDEHSSFIANNDNLVKLITDYVVQGHHMDDDHIHKSFSNSTSFYQDLKAVIPDITAFCKNSISFGIAMYKYKTVLRRHLGLLITKTKNNRGTHYRFAQLAEVKDSLDDLGELF